MNRDAAYHSKVRHVQSNTREKLSCFQTGAIGESPLYRGNTKHWVLTVLSQDLTIVKRRKFRWYGHVSCSSGLARTISQGTAKGRRRQGRQRKRWDDNIRDWTGLKLAKSQRAAENREKWRKPIVKSSVVPQRPQQLRDR